jgi:parallel beta-helix repeat protein
MITFRSRQSARIILSFLFPAYLVGLGGCSDSGDQVTPADPTATSISPAVTVEEQLRMRMAIAKPGDVIEIPAGRHSMSRSLVMNASGITIRGTGAGRGEQDSILSFASQIAGAEGMLLSGDNLTLEDFAVEDSKGDAIKIKGGQNVIVRAVRTEWTRGPATDNGSYGIYPVQIENLLIEDSVAIAASDAGIYVGQSRNIVVRNNIVRDNVAGIEIENSVGADVYENLAENNTGGVLVFNMPDINMTGERTRVYNNDIRNNNTPNFGAPGTAVSGVPTGSGIVINSNDRVEIFNNRIGGNDTANIIISSYFSANYAGQLETSEGFDPYPETLYIYANSFTPGGSNPGTSALDGIRRAIYGEDGRLPDLLWDGARNPELLADGVLPAAKRICIDNGDAIMINVDLLNEGENTNSNMEAFRCEHPKLKAIELGSLTG